MHTPVSVTYRLFAVKFWAPAALSLCVATSACTLDPTTSSQPSDAPQAQIVSLVPGSSLSTPAYLVAITRYFAPVIYQYHRAEYTSDFITKVTFDGDWDGMNNWDHSATYPQPAYVYASIIEDDKMYFIHYGTYHARDLCESGQGGMTAPGECIAEDIGLENCGPVSALLGRGDCHSQHESDMEGVTLTIEKRRATASWPYGQIITAQTIFHHEKLMYRNCAIDFAPGITMSSEVAPVVNGVFPKVDWFRGCIPFRDNAPGATTPNAPKRVEMLVDYGGHAVQLGRSTDHWLLGIGEILYYPTDNTAGVPNVSLCCNVLHVTHWHPVYSSPPTPYAIQMLTDPELGGQSLFDRRYGTVTAPFVYWQNIYPNDFSWLTKFVSSFGSMDGATPPWAQDAGGGNLPLGVWHNHPSWNWRKIWKPIVPQSAPHFYPCRESWCYGVYSYIFNPFWLRPNPPPPPAFTVAIVGLSSVGPTTNGCPWTAVISGGSPPYEFNWSGLLEGSAESVSGNIGESGLLSVDVIDANGWHRNVVHSITYVPGGQIYCE